MCIEPFSCTLISGEARITAVDRCIYLMTNTFFVSTTLKWAGLFVPYYELLVPNPGVPMSDWFDPEEYANYDLILLPAVMR